MSFRTLLASFSLLALLHVNVLRAADEAVQVAPLVATKDAPVLPGGELRSFVAARRALELGFPSVAAGLYTQLLASLQTVGAERDALILELVTARLDEGKTDEAELALRLHSGAPAPAYQLRLGLVSMRRKRIEAARTAASAIKPEELSLGDRGWWYFLQGQLADSAGDFAKAREAYQRAADIAVSDLQRAHFALAREQARLNLGETSEAQLNTLRQSFERYQGRGVGYAYARQYAAMLAARGRAPEAIDFLNKQLQELPAGERAARDDFRLLLGLIAGAQRAEGRAALEGLLTRADDITLQRVALQLLARDAADAAFYAKLNTLISAPPQHPIIADLLLVRAQLALSEKRIAVLDKSGGGDLAAITQGNQAQADADAKALLSRFPNSELKPAALALLADLAWQLNRYRSAADFAAQARASLPAGEVRASLGVLAAEAYFRAKDFPAAEAAYATTLGEVPAGVSIGALMGQRVLARVEAGRLDAAASLLDEYAKDSRFEPVDRWQSEWMLARAFQTAGRAGDAYARVNRLLAISGAAAEALPGELRARVAWLQARLALETGDASKTLELADGVVKLADQLEPALQTEVRASMRLLQAKARFELGQAEEALTTLAALRVDFPQSDSAVYSYIDEADYYSADGNLVRAQTTLLDLADKFKQHDYAPYALYRAALNAEQRGQNAFYEEAYRILDRLVKTYPQSDQVFYAVLKQGDLARRLNEFGRAQLAYEFLINNHAQHRDVLAAELALAACHRAQITPTDVSHFESALAILERLQDLPSATADLRVEAGFQLGDLLATKRSPDFARRAEAAWWTLATTFLLDDAQAAKLGPKGRYWMARTLLRLGDSRRDNGDLEEARNAYDLILRKNLPFFQIAREALLRAGGKP